MYARTYRTVPSACRIGNLGEIQPNLFELSLYHTTCMWSAARNRCLHHLGLVPLSCLSRGANRKRGECEDLAFLYMYLGNRKKKPPLRLVINVSKEKSKHIHYRRYSFADAICESYDLPQLALLLYVIATTAPCSIPGYWCLLFMAPFFFHMPTNLKPKRK
ncbi:hypothetical protein F5X99DRAFT_78668 [Biscogniauxia marginata]|nr:hypothetical protein F5X99DRAFT_78668 [Biscogniauxia marginata]